MAGGFTPVVAVVALSTGLIALRAGVYFLLTLRVVGLSDRGDADAAEALFIIPQELKIKAV